MILLEKVSVNPQCPVDIPTFFICDLLTLGEFFVIIFYELIQLLYVNLISLIIALVITKQVFKPKLILLR
jgi:hypothetical protein